MGFWNRLGREVVKVVHEGSAPSTPSKKKPKAAGTPSQETTPEALRGPDPGTLVSASEIEATTGSPPVGEGDRRSGGIDVDTGFMRVCIWQLADGGELLVNFTRLRDDEAVALWRTRWDDPGWRNVDDEKPLEGVGEAGRWYITKASKGGTELHVSAKQGMFQSQITHTSPAGSRDIGPVTQLLTTVLARLNA